ncbi:MAG: hypothetical protein JRD89_20430 [Deltaproteobacteria bacterium]|nr:hypothetical protein [Deltaproteobacteria bacterium]
MAGDAVLERLEDVFLRIEEKYRESVKRLEELLMKFESMTPEEHMRRGRKAIMAAAMRGRKHGGRR